MTVRLPASILLLVGAVLAAPAAGWAEQADCTGGHGSSDEALQGLDIDDYRQREAAAVLEAGAYRLGEVRFFRQNVFPEARHWLARLANRFNTVTKDRTLRAAFPIDPGGDVDARMIREAERVLRDKPYLYDAVVLVRRICGEHVDVDVVVRDVWTLTPAVGVSRSGGDNKTVVTFSDSNLLGWGKAFSVEYVDDRDRSGAFLSYTDPNINGSRWQGSVVVADNDDGERYGLELGRPFYALDTPYSFGFGVDHFTREQDLEFLNSDIFELNAETDQANLFVARSQRRNGWVHRTHAGVRYIKESFEFPAGFPGPLETSRRFAYPYVAWSLLQDQFVKRVDVNRVGVTEDLQLGWSSYAELGWAPDAIGNRGDTLLGRAWVEFNRYMGDKHLFSAALRFSGRYDLDRSRTEDVSMKTRLAYLWRQAPKWRMLASVDYHHTRNLPLDKQLTLGGDTGLRGYPSRYQPGDRSWLATLEQRYYSNAYPFDMFRVGYALFVDAGRAWFEDDEPAWMPPRRGEHFQTLTNVGFGLRLESVRTRRDRVVHLDFAKPLVDGPKVDSWEFTISAKQSL